MNDLYKELAIQVKNGDITQEDADDLFDVMMLEQKAIIDELFNPQMIVKEIYPGNDTIN